jgi:hypothetical protein
MPKWTTKEFVDEAYGNRDVVALANMVRDEELPAEVKQHLSSVILGHLSGTTNFPKRRPPKKGLYWEKRSIAERVWRAKKANGWKKIGSAVDHVAQELRCSSKTVWNAWKVFDPVAYELKQEELLFDALLDAANEARWESAIESLKAEHGEREFTDEEIADAAYEIDQQDWRDHDDY